MKALASEPLVHFFIFAGLLIAARALWEPNEDELVIDDALVRGLHESYGGDGITDEVLIEDWLREELLYREALASGLHLGDPIVRRRLVQKMEALLSSGEADPSDSELQRHLARHRTQFTTDQAVTFEHRFFSAERRSDAEADAAAALERLRSGDESPSGDTFLLGHREVQRTELALNQRFGGEFGTQAMELAPNGWQGPVRSRFGFHLVFVEERQLARTADLDSVRAEVEAAWREEARQERLRDAIDELRARASVRRVP